MPVDPFPEALPTGLYTYTLRVQNLGPDTANSVVLTEKLTGVSTPFTTDNDSELIAVWVSDQMSKGLSREEALHKSIGAIDGVFTFMISDTQGIGFAKDRFAMKPLVTVEDGDELAAATEEQAVRRVVRDECHVINYDGPSLTRIWAVGPQTAVA